MQAGSKIAVRVRGARLDGAAHGSDGQGGAIAEFFAPGKDPRAGPGAPDRVAALAFDPVTRTYAADVRTAGWVPGAWTCRGTVLGADGVPEGWDYYSFPLDP